MARDLKISIEKLEARTKAGRLRGLMPMIEAKIRQGMRDVDVIRVLNDQGFAISEYTYRSYLQRYRKRADGKARRWCGVMRTTRLNILPRTRIVYALCGLWKLPGIETSPRLGTFWSQ